MKQRTRSIVLLVTLALLASGAPTVLADGAKGIVVKPLIAKPGDTITVKGDKLGAGSTVEVRVIGAGTDRDLGEVKADAAGDFSAEFRLPADLPPGSYTVQATGTERATTQLTIVGNAAENPAAALPIRSRPPGQALGLVALFVVLAGAGLFFARTAGAREAGGAR